MSKPKWKILFIYCTFLYNFMKTSLNSCLTQKSTKCRTLEVEVEPHIARSKDSINFQHTMTEIKFGSVCSVCEPQPQLRYADSRISRLESGCWTCTFTFRCIGLLLYSVYAFPSQKTMLLACRRVNKETRLKTLKPHLLCYILSWVNKTNSYLNRVIYNIFCVSLF